MVPLFVMACGDDDAAPSASGGSDAGGGVFSGGATVNGGSNSSGSNSPNGGNEPTGGGAGESGVSGGVSAWPGGAPNAAGGQLGLAGESGASSEGQTAGEGGAPGGPGAAGSSDGGSSGAENGGGGGGSPTGSAGDGAEAGSGGASGEFQIPVVDEAALPEPAAESGFIELEATEYVAGYESSATRTTQATRLFYSFIPAEDHAKERPVFVFFNGGPGYTSMLLAGFGTGPRTLNGDEPTAPPTSNVASFSRFGSLLYIDSRQAGFSYGLAEHPDLEGERSTGFSDANFNAAVDGADFTRALLRILERQPAARNNPVVIVGESYGGTRASVLLDSLLNPEQLASGGDVLIDSALAAEIHEHYRAVFPGLNEAELSAEQRAKQFGWQVLIQPWVAGTFQRDAQNAVKDRVYQRMSSESGLTVSELVDNCAYHTLKSDAWCDDVDAAVVRTMTTPADFRDFFGVNLESVPRLKAAERLGAFRVTSGNAPRDPGPLVSLLGAVANWDQYFRLQAESSFSAYGSPYYVLPFARNLRYVETLITNAQWDSVVMSEAIFSMLGKASGSSAPDSLARVEYEGSSDLDHPSERVHISFNAGATRPALDRVVYFPVFEDAGHMVTVSEPLKFVSEVQAFLGATGLLAE